MARDVAGTGRDAGGSGAGGERLRQSRSAGVEKGGKTGANLVGTVRRCQAVAAGKGSERWPAQKTTAGIARKIPLSRVIGNRYAALQRAHDPVRAPV